MNGLNLGANVTITIPNDTYYKLIGVGLAIVLAFFLSKKFI